MAPHGPCWILLAPHGSSRLLMAPHGTSWLLLAPHGSSWLLMAPHGSSWLLIPPHASSWLFLAPPGSSWLPLLFLLLLLLLAPPLAARLHQAIAKASVQPFRRPEASSPVCRLAMPADQGPQRTHPRFLLRGQEPRRARKSQEKTLAKRGGPWRNQEVPGSARKSEEEPRTKTQEEPGRAMRTQEEPERPR
jgi:hypothetical protein